MNKLRILGILTLAVAFGFAGVASATLTLDQASVIGTGNVTIDGITTSNYAIGPTTTTGTITIGGTAQTGAVKLGDSTGALALSLGTGATGAKTIHIGDAATTNVITIGGGAGTVAINSGTWGVSTTGAMTGITGLTMTGAAVTDGIDLTGAVMTHGIANTLFRIGTYGTPQVLPTLTDNYIPLQVSLQSVNNPTGGVQSLIGGYFRVANATNNQANLQLVGVAPRVSMVKNVNDAYGTQSHLVIGAGAVSPIGGNLTAISGKTTVMDNVATGAVTAGLFTLQAGADGAPTSVTPVNANVLWAEVTQDAHVGSIFLGNADPSDGSSAARGLTLAGPIATGIDMHGVNGMTTDIVLSSGTVIKTGAATPIGGGACPTGSLYVRKDGADIGHLLYLCVGTAWERLTLTGNAAD